jgi:hypothetical protein
MRYSEILQEDANQPVPSLRNYYHVTTTRRIKSILANGLEPGHHRRWKNAFGKKLGDLGHIYLISDLPHAIQWAANMEWDHFQGKIPAKSPYVIVVVQADPATLKPDPHPQNGLYGRSWFMKEGAIAPQNIVKVIPLTAELKKQVVNDGQSIMESLFSPSLQKKCVRSLVKRGWVEEGCPGCFVHDNYPGFMVHVDTKNPKGPFVIFHNGERIETTNDPEIEDHGHLRKGSTEDDPYDFVRQYKAGK